MATLNNNEHQQNKAFLDKFLKEHYSHINLSEKDKADFLEKCRTNSIWLQGLSPLVQVTFLQALTLALQNTQNIEQNLHRVFQLLRDKLKEENEYLKWQFTKSAALNSQPCLTIAQYLEKNRSVPDDYWLQTDDMIQALTPLAKHSEIYIHQPVTRIDSSVTACVETALNTTGAKVAYVMVDSGGHWTLNIYKKVNDNIVHTHYNPPGDGKCGDHVLNKIYEDVQQILATDLGYRAGNVRQQTIQAIEKSGTLSGKPEQQSSIGTKALAPAVRTAKTDFSELDKLYHQWNALANRVLDEIAHYSKEKRAEMWDKFFNDATTNIKGKRWDATLFHHHQCAVEINTVENNTSDDIKQAISNSLLIK